MDKELRELSKAADEQGWRWVVLKSGHVMFFPPDKRFDPVVFAGTPSDRRSFLNSMAKMKRAGFTWPRPERKSK